MDGTDSVHTGENTLLCMTEMRLSAHSNKLHVQANKILTLPTKSISSNSYNLLP